MPRTYDGRYYPGRYANAEYGASKMGDFIEPIAALRLWRHWPTDGLLHGTASKEPWAPGHKLRARCLVENWPSASRSSYRRIDERNCSEAPNIIHGCGIYGLKNVGAARDLIDYYGIAGWNEHLIVGKVYLWGSILEGSYGYRAEFGYPAAFCDLKGTPLAKEMAELYEVQLVPEPELLQGVAAWGTKRSFAEWTK